LPEWVGACIFAGVIALVCLPLIVSFPPQPRVRISLRGKTALTMPPLCAVTGVPGAESHPAHSLCPGHDYLIFRVAAVEVPFSSTGWERYKSRYPLSLRLLEATGKGGTDFVGPLTKIPLLGWYFAPILASLHNLVVATPSALLAGLLAFGDLLTGRRKLIKVHAVHIEGAVLCGIDVSVASSVFAEEFARLNPNTTIGKRWWQFWK
jgi:hypothetical protein